MKSSVISGSNFVRENLHYYLISIQLIEAPVTIISANLILSTSRLGTGMGREVSHLLATKGRKVSNKAKEIKKNDSTFERVDQFIVKMKKICQDYAVCMKTEEINYCLRNYW